jgi:hypothetical protein
MVDGGQEEYVAAFDEGLLVAGQLGADDDFVHSIGQPQGIEFLLPGSMLCAVNITHYCPLN